MRDQMPTPEAVAFQVKEMTSSSMLSRSKQVAASLREDNGKKWQHLPVDVFKINTDGPFRANEQNGAWGFVIRDNDGQGVLAGSGCLSAVNDALAAEGEACIAALEAAMDRGISHNIIETDSTNLVSALLSSAFYQAPGGVIFRELRDTLELHFVVRSIYYVPRFCNQCAHALAQSGLDRDPDHPASHLG